MLALLAVIALAPAAPGHYTGHTSEGGHVTLRVRRSGRRLGQMDFGPIKVTCADPGNPPRTEPSHSVYDHAIHADGRFGGDGFFTSGNAYAIRGHFTSRRRVVGTVSIPTRDDCFGRVSFVAVRRGP